MTCDCCRRGPSHWDYCFAGSCYECVIFGASAGLPLSAVADFIELCRDCDAHRILD